MSLFLGYLFYSIDPYVCFVPVPVPLCFDYYSFVVLSEVWEGYASSFVLFLQDCFGNSGSFKVPYFRVIYSDSVKNVTGNLIGIALNL